MADIELVVKIDAERYEAIKKHNGIPTVSDGVDAADAILNGTPLDKIRADIIALAEGWNGMQAKNVPLGAVLKVIDKHTSGKKE